MRLQDQEILTMDPLRHRLAVIGIGNTIAGDDGAGAEVVRRLKKEWRDIPSLLFHTLEGDHFEIADLLDRAEKFIFVDAFAGEQPGIQVFAGSSRRAFSPSFHQTDVASVMGCLEALRIIEPFPPWEVWGVTIIPPTRIGEGLSKVVDEAVGELCRKLGGRIEEIIRQTG